MATKEVAKRGRGRPRLEKPSSHLHVMLPAALSQALREHIDSSSPELTPRAIVIHALGLYLAERGHKVY